MASNFIFVAVCLLLVQLPGFLTKPTDQEISSDHHLWAASRSDPDYYSSQKQGLLMKDQDDNYRVAGKKGGTEKLITEIIDILNTFMANSTPPPGHAMSRYYIESE